MSVTTAPSLQRFLDTIAFSEGTSDGLDGGYGVIVRGANGANTFTDYSDHPFAPQFDRPPVVVRVGPPQLLSTAAGRYQLLYRYWKVYKVQLGLPDYSHASQDAVALQQMKERGALDMVLAGNIQGAITACATIWASFPGNSYGQGGHSMQALLERYDALA